MKNSQSIKKSIIKSKISELKFIESLVEGKPLFSEEILQLTKWTSEYYFCAWGEVLNAAVPGGLTLRLETSFSSQIEITFLPKVINVGELLAPLNNKGIRRI